MADINIKKVSSMEKTIKTINEALFYDKEKINKLWNNILLVLDNLEENALTIWIVWEWWSWKTSFLNILLENITGNSQIEYLYNNEIIDNYNDWVKIQNKIKYMKLADENEKIKINEEEISIKWLYVLNINSWLINNIVSDPLYNLISLVSKELDLKLDDNIEKVIKASKKTWNLTAWILNKLALKNDDQELEVWLPKFTDVTDDIIELKEKFTKKLDEKLWWENKLIIIIDDLDRITPEDAVTMIDSIKLFLDNPNILIYLLNDKDIVQRWLKTKLKLDWKEAEKISKSYLDKLISIEINIEKYYSREQFDTSIKEFILWNEFLSKMSYENKTLAEKIVEDKNIINDLYSIKNMRRLKKLLNNFRIQAPSIAIYEKGNNESMINAYFKIFKQMLKEYVEDKEETSKNQN